MKREYVIPHETMVRIGACNPTVIEDPANLALHNFELMPNVLYYAVNMCGSIAWEVVMANPGTLLDFANSCPNGDPFFGIWPDRQAEIQWPPSGCLTMQDIYFLRVAWQEKVWPAPDGTVFRPPAAGSVGQSAEPIRILGTKYK